MPSASTWNAFVWSHFAKPKCDRGLYRRISKTKPQRIVELGIGELTRTSRAIRMAQRASQKTVHYCGIDLFEARPGGALKLKETHQSLSQLGAKIRLVPGDLMSALGRTANMLGDTDLLIIDSSQLAADLEAAFPFLPRMLTSETSIARYDLSGPSQRLRWMKPDSFVQPDQPGQSRQPQQPGRRAA